MVFQLENLALLLSIGIGIFLVVGGIMKFLGFKEFKSIVRSYRIFPQSAIRPAAYAIPIIEISIGILLPLFFTSRLLVSAAMLMMLSYTFAIVYLMISGIKMSNCGCMGAIIPMRPSWMKVGINLLIFVAMLTLLLV